MKTKNICIIIACVMLAAFVLGATGTMNMVNPANQAMSSDRLIGVLITRKHLDLFDSEQFFADNISELANGREISESESAKYQGRLYATLVETTHVNEETGETHSRKEYVFDGVDGFSYFAPNITDEFGTYRSMSGDNTITDGNIHINSTDEGETVSLKGTIYVSASGNQNIFCFNPVYQSSTGEVYAVSGNSMSAGNIAGTSMSHKITENQSETSSSSTTSSGTEVEITISYIDEPTNVSILQFDGKNELLLQMDFVPGTLPNILQVQPGTQYIIVETTTYSQEKSKTIIREIYQKEDETLYTFFRRDDGICVKQWCEINWDN